MAVEHIKEFSTKWGRLTAQVSGGTDTSKAVGVLALLTKCDETKAITLLESFPDYYQVVINNIAIQENLSVLHFPMSKKCQQSHIMEQNTIVF
jgi:hypothetical protein